MTSERNPGRFRIAVDRDGAGVGEDVRVDLVPVEDPSGLDRELVEQRELAPRVHSRKGRIAVVSPHAQARPSESPARSRPRR